MEKKKLIIKLVAQNETKKGNMKKGPTNYAICLFLVGKEIPSHPHEWTKGRVCAK